MTLIVMEVMQYAVQMLYIILSPSVQFIATPELHRKTAQQKNNTRQPHSRKTELNKCKT